MARAIEVRFGLVLMQRDPECCVTLVDAGIAVRARRGEEGARDLDLLIAKLCITVEPLMPCQVDIARKAYRGYGR